MRWDEQLFGLFDELEARAEELYDAEREVELLDRSRAEYAEVPLLGRLLASVDTTLAMDLVGGAAARGVLRRVGAGWCLLEDAGQDWVVRTDAVVGVVGASARAVPEQAWSPVHRLSLGSALRRVAAAGASCLVHLADGRRREGRLQRVGADFVEVEVGEGAGARHLLVPFTGLAAVQSREPVE